VYGQDVETLVQEEDSQLLSEPIVAPVKVRRWIVEEKDMPETRFDKGCVSSHGVGHAKTHWQEQLPAQYDCVSGDDSKRCSRRPPASWQDSPHGYACLRDT
jgi:hypothetical protein